MDIIRNDRTDPYYNMAAEEYLLRTRDVPALMLWQNEPAVVIGKNQDARLEVDFAYAKAHGVRVVRRLSGGGAVFHDLGNVNYSFIAPDHAALDFDAFCAPILRALASLGIEAARSGRNDLVVQMGDGTLRKFSGTAQCVFRRPNGKTSLLHHGTLLFDADVSALAGVLTPDRSKLAEKGIKSVGARVINLASLLPTGRFADACAFKRFLESYFAESGAAAVAFSAEAAREIEVLAREKYASDAWLFGDAPTASRIRRRRFAFGTVCAALSLRETDGAPVIERVRFSGDFFGAPELGALETALRGVPLCNEPLLARLRTLPLGDLILGATPEAIADLLCGAE